MVRWCIAAALLLAGCSASPAAEEATDEPATRVVVSEEGSIDLTVIIVDGSITPVANATVAIPAQNLTTQTSSDGAVVFAGLAPGTYIITGSALGFLPASTVVELLEDQVVKILIERNPTYVEPAIKTISLKGFINGTESNFARGSGKDLFFRDCKCVINRPQEPGLRGWVVDVVWEDTIAKPVGEPRKFRWLITTDETFDWEVRRGPTPWTEHVDPSIFNSHNSTEWWEIMFYMDDDWVRWQQPFEAHWSAFVAMDIPEGWSLVPRE